MTFEYCSFNWRGAALMNQGFLQHQSAGPRSPLNTDVPTRIPQN